MQVYALFQLALIWFLAALAGKWQRSAERTLTMLQREREDVDTLRRWLSQRGWDTVRTPAGIIIQRALLDAEERRLRAR